ncbi:MAG: hypothetical protein OQK12_08020 [Motiliproteus sp.]|nr:hypothetical protein [Motiliproteus sp.]MCW9053181.1 hypothetical protein [Motiliproteus sp.]
MSNTAGIERRYLQSAERLAGRENVKFDSEALDALKPIIRNGVLKLDVMGFLEDESRIDAAESNLQTFIRGMAKDAKSQSIYKIKARMVESAITKGSVWPFS